VLVDPAEAMVTPWIAAALQRGTDAGIFVSVATDGLTALRADGNRGPALKAAALVVPCPSQADLPVLLLIASSNDSANALLSRLIAQVMTCMVSVGLGEDGSLVRLPWREASR
jgi:hypothetical protein